MNSVKPLHSKVLSKPELESQLITWRETKQKIVFTNGCFDILHLGHVTYLAKARNLGDKLIVGLNTNNSIERIKGVGRPIKDELSRGAILAAMQFVDAVVFFNERSPIDLISTITPDVLVKGADYTIADIVGHKLVIKNGGEVRTIDLVAGYSSSSLIDKILKG